MISLGLAVDTGALRMQVEADSFGCLSKLLDGIQDHYTFAQPGIQRLVFRFKELVRRIDGTFVLPSLSNSF